MGCGKSTIKQSIKPVNPRPRGSIKLAPSVFRLLSHKIYSEEYEKIEDIGSGSFGEVILSYHKPSNTRRAVKVIKKNSLCMDQQDPEFLIKEFKILRELDHPHILKCFEVFEDDFNFHIVTEFCSSGTLFSEIVKLKKFTEYQASEIIRQILSALVYCHNKKIVHRDLKPENIFLTESETPNIKLADFGNSIELKSESRLQGLFGSAYYMAPEVFRGNYDEKCDLWSIGIILFVMITGKAPYPGKSNSEILKNVKKKPFKLSKYSSKQISIKALDLIKQLTIIDPKERFSAEKALNHPWILKLNKGKKKDKEILILELKNFHNQSMLRQAVYYFITSQISSDRELTRFQKIFEELDLNGDGKISLEELVQEYRKVYSKDEATSIANHVMLSVDLDMNGEINYTEFLTICNERMRNVSLDKLEAAFNLFDTDRNGSISLEEIKALLIGEGVEDENFWIDIMREADTNEDGEIDLKEFLILMTASVQNSKTIKMIKMLEKSNISLFKNQESD